MLTADHGEEILNGIGQKKKEMHHLCFSNSECHMKKERFFSSSYNTMSISLFLQRYRDHASPIFFTLPKAYVHQQTSRSMVLTSILSFCTEISMPGPLSSKETGFLEGYKTCIQLALRESESSCLVIILSPGASITEKKQRDNDPRDEDFIIAGSQTVNKVFLLAFYLRFLTSFSDTPSE